MPFQSKAQERYLYAKRPDIAKRWQSEAPSDYKKLPEKKRGKGMRGSKPEP